MGKNSARKLNFRGRSWRRALFLFVFLGMLFCQISEVFAAGQVEWRPIKVACNINKALYLDEEGNPKGYCANLIKTLARENHWMVSYVPGNWSESVKALEAGEIDLLFPTQKTDQRMNTMNFSNLIGGYQLIGLFANKNSNYYYNDYASYNGARIAVSKGSSNEQALENFAKENNFSYQPVYIATTEGKVRALKEGQVDLISVSTLARLEELEAVAIMSYEPFYFTMNKKNEWLTKQINDGMAHVMSTHPEIVSKMYMDFLGEGTKAAFSREEHEWIQSHKKIVVGCYQDTPPLYHALRGEQPHGVFVDVLALLAKKSGLEIEIKPLDRSQYAYNLLEDGTIDLIIGSNDVSLDLQADSRFTHTSPLMEYNTVAVSKADYDASKKNPVYVLTTARKYWYSLILKQYPKARVIYAKDSKECLLAVQNKTADVTLLNTWEYNYFSKSPRFTDLVEWENERVSASLVMVALAKGDSNIVSIMEKSIASLSHEEVNDIISSNLNRPYDDYTIADRIYAMGPLIVAILVVLVFLALGLIIYNAMRKRYVSELEANNAQLKVANEAKDLFLSRISHELRTPLNAISGNAALLKEFVEEKQGIYSKEYDEVQDIQKSEFYLQRIINGILDTHKIENGEFILTPEIYNASKFLEEIGDRYRILAEEKGIKLTFARLTSLGEYYRVDAMRLEQVINNLLSNALKFTKTGGKVTFTAQSMSRSGDKNVELKFTVTDTGIGMSESFLEEHLFQTFRKENEGNTSSYEGVGIGLSFCRKLARVMGGDITCVSKQNFGSTFTFTVPAEIVDASTVENIENSLATAQKSDFKGKKILLCEDNLINQKMLYKLLIKKNCEVIIANNGQQGLDVFTKSAEGEFALILMDLRMPVLDGYEATKAIRGLSRADASTVPIIAISANAYAQDISLALAVGMNAHLVKPVDINKLYETMAKFLLVN